MYSLILSSWTLAGSAGLVGTGVADVFGSEFAKVVVDAGDLAAAPFTDDAAEPEVVAVLLATVLEDVLPVALAVAVIEAFAAVLTAVFSAVLAVVELAGRDGVFVFESNDIGLVMFFVRCGC